MKEILQNKLCDARTVAADQWVAATRVVAVLFLMIGNTVSVSPALKPWLRPIALATVLFLSGWEMPAPQTGKEFLQLILQSIKTWLIPIMAIWMIDYFWSVIKSTVTYIGAWRTFLAHAQSLLWGMTRPSEEALFRSMQAAGLFFGLLFCTCLYGLVRFFLRNEHPTVSLGAGMAISLLGSLLRRWVDFPLALNLSLPAFFAICTGGFLKQTLIEEENGELTGQRIVTGIGVVVFILGTVVFASGTEWLFNANRAAVLGPLIECGAALAICALIWLLVRIRILRRALSRLGAIWVVLLIVYSLDDQWAALWRRWSALGLRLVVRVALDLLFAALACGIVRMLALYRQRHAGETTDAEGGDASPLIRRVYGWLCRLRDCLQTHPLICAAAYTAIFLGMLCVFARPMWETTDDFTLSCLMNGVFGSSSPYILVSSYFFGALCFWLGQIAPALNWFGFFELLSVYFSFLALNYLLFSRSDKHWVKCALLLSALFECGFFLCLTYTRSAILLGFSGGALIADTCIRYDPEEQSNQAFLRKSIAGGLMVLFGSWFRWSGLYIALAYVAAFVATPVFSLLKKGRGAVKAIRLRNLLIRFGVPAAVLVVALILHLSSTIICNSNEDIRNYREYNLSRADVSDYLPREYKDSPPDNSGFYISENDYEMIKYSIIYDQYFNTDFWEHASAYLFDNASERSDQKQLSLRVLIDRLLYFSQGKYRNQAPLFVVWCLMAAAAFLCMHRKNAFGILCTVIGTIALVACFSWIGRFPPWVEDSLFFLSCFVLLNEICVRPIDGARLKERGKHIAVVVLLFFCLVLRAVSTRKEIKAYSYDAQFSELMEMVEQNDENVFLYDSVNNAPYPLIDLYGPLCGLPKGSLENFIRVGNWDIQHPVKNQQLAYLGIDSPLSSLISDDRVRLISINAESGTAPVVLERYVTFFREHYDMDVSYEKESTWGDYAVWRFHKVGICLG